MEIARRHYRRDSGSDLDRTLRVLAVVPVNCRFEQMAVNQRLRALSDLGAVDIIASYPESFPADISSAALISSFAGAKSAIPATVRFPVFSVQVAIWALVRRILRRSRYDIVYTFQDTSAVAGWILGPLAGRWVMDVLDDPMQSRGNASQRRQHVKAGLLRVYESIIAFLLRRASTIFTIGINQDDPLPRQLIDGYRVDPGRIIPLRQSVDIRGIQQGVCLAKAATIVSTPQLTFVGYVSTLRGVDVLIRAAEILRNRDTDVKVTLIGHLKEKDRNWLDEMCAGFPDIEYCGVLSSWEALRRMSTSTVGVLPFPHRRDLAYVQAVTGVEYLAMGRPIVATDLPGSRALVDQHVNGILVPPGDAHAMADAIERIICTPGLADEMSKAAFKKADSFDSLCIRQEVVNVLGA